MNFGEQHFGAAIRNRFGIRKAVCRALSGVEERPLGGNSGGTADPFRPDFCLDSGFLFF
jgi:hypothetical protein